MSEVKIMNEKDYVVLAMYYIFLLNSICINIIDLRGTFYVVLSSDIA